VGRGEGWGDVGGRRVGGKCPRPTTTRARPMFTGLCV